MTGKFPKSYSTRDKVELLPDYSEAVSYDAFHNPLEVIHYKGGSYDLETGAYTGGVVISREFHRWSADGQRWLSTFVQ